MVIHSTDCIIYGASGHGRVIMDMVQLNASTRLVGFYDDNQSLSGTAIHDYPIFTDLDFDSNLSFIIGIGIIIYGLQHTI